MSELKREEEHTGSIWKHPYMVYVVLTAVLFGFLLVMGWLAVSNNWIPQRRI